MPNTVRTDTDTPSSPAHPRTAYRESREAEMKIFSRRLWRLMVAAGWNQSELARRSGVGRDMISGYVRGRHMPDPPHAQKLADALGVPIEDLFPSASEADLPGLAIKEAPPLELRATGDGKAMLHVNLELPMSVALKVLTLIQAEGVEAP